MKSMKLFCILALGMILLPATDGFSCTIVMATKGDIVLAGNNEDGKRLQTRVNFIPAATGRFGCVYFGFDDSMPQGGMNDHGLFFDANAVYETGWRADPAKSTFQSIGLNILQICATVADVRKFFETYNMPSLKKARFPFADRSGASMVVEYAGGKVRYVTEKTWYQVSTNFLRTDYPGAEVPCNRFRLARQMLDPANELSVPLIRSILSATHLEGDYPTVYSNIYDLKAGLIYLYHFHNFEEVVIFNLAEELKKGARSIELPTLFSVQPHAAKQFLDRQMKPSFPVLMEIYNQNGAAAALARYEQMCWAANRVYDIGEEQITRFANAMLQREDAQTALAFYTGLSDYLPDSWQAYEGIGRAQMALDHKAEAIAAFRRSLAIRPDNPWATDMLKGLEMNLGGNTSIIENNIIPSTEKTFVLPPSALLPIPNRSQEPDAPDLVWDVETCIQMGMAYYNKAVSQKAICSAGKPAHSSLDSNEIDTALEALGVQYFSWDWRNQDLTQFLAWIKTNLAKGYPVFCGIKMNPTQHPEWSIDLFVLAVGYNEGGLFIDTNIIGDGRILVTYSQLASLINRYSFENQYHYYFGRAFLGVKDPGLLVQNQEPEKNIVPSPAAGKPVSKLKPVAVDSSKLKRLTGRYTAGGQARIITFDGEKLFIHREGGVIYMPIPFSETEFGFDDDDSRLRFELAGDKVIGIHRCPANGPEEPLQPRVEPIDDKNPQVTALVQQYIREAMDGTLKPDFFTPNLAAQIFPDQVKEAGAFFRSLGLQTGIDLYERVQQGGGYRYLYRLSYREKIIALRLSVVENNRISEVEFYLE